MAFGWSTGVTTLARQTRRTRLLHVIFGSVLSLSTTILVVTVIFGSSLFASAESSEADTKETLSFSSVDKSSPLPILMRHSKTSNATVQVLGESIKRNESIHSETNSSLQTFSNKYIKHFAYSVLPVVGGFSITTTWNLQHIKSDFLFVICETNDKIPDMEDLEIYSVAGKDLKESSQTFELTSIQERLYLKVYLLQESGDYSLIDTSPLVTKTN